MVWTPAVADTVARTVRTPPLWLWGYYGERYDISQDLRVTRWWAFGVRLRLDVLGHGPRAYGITLRLTWGWA